ncbi:unnamed protein product, partial [Mesorhabditis belari]|uniref:Uncharacterized protein n=1 Tax=Mesorhabditis belari TaxID=2138241 RepID=A0AAF3EL15_9BILA
MIFVIFKQPVFVIFKQQQQHGQDAIKERRRDGNDSKYQILKGASQERERRKQGSEHGKQRSEHGKQRSEHGKQRSEHEKQKRQSQEIRHDKKIVKKTESKNVREFCYALPARLKIGLFCCPGRASPGDPIHIASPQLSVENAVSEVVAQGQVPPYHRAEQGS